MGQRGRRPCEASLQGDCASTSKVQTRDTKQLGKLVPVKLEGRLGKTKSVEGGDLARIEEELLFDFDPRLSTGRTREN